MNELRENDVVLVLADDATDYVPATVRATRGQHHVSVVTDTGTYMTVKLSRVQRQVA